MWLTCLIYSIIVSSLSAPLEFSPLMTILFFPSLSITLLAWKLFPKNWKVFNLIPLRINDTLLLCFTFNIVAEILVYREDIVYGFVFGLVIFTAGLAVNDGVISGVSIPIGVYIITNLSEALP